MSNLTLTIGGRNFTVACTAGEEEHVEALGRAIDAKVTAVDGATGQSESRMLLFAALMLADELSERGPSLALAGSEQMATIADRLENLAATLEAAAAGD